MGIGLMGFGVPETCDRSADWCDSERELADDELRVDVKNLTTEAAEVAVATGVGRATETMVRTVHFDDQAEGWGEEVGDVVTEDDLAAEGDAELRAGELGPQEAFGFRGGAAVLLRA